MDDQELYHRFLQGHMDAFEELVLRHKDNLIGYLLRMVGGDIYTAEDLAQEVFAEIYVQKTRFFGASSLKTYLFSLGRNKAVDYLRKYGRLDLWDPRMFPEGENPEAGPEEALLQWEKAEHLAGSLARLSPEHAQVLRLREEELSYADMGNLLGKPLGQVKILLHRARKALRKIMEEGEA